MALQNLSWKGKLVVLFIVGVMGLIAFVFSPSGQKWMIGSIDRNFQETPENERRDSPLADRYMQLAWWRANILLDSKTAMEMYKEFCGIQEDPKTKMRVFESGRLVSKYCSPDGKTGWGPLHPRAPEAYCAYLECLEPVTSSQIHVMECYNYYRLFYNWPLQHGQKIHPYFNAYWPKIQLMIHKGHVPCPPDINLSAPGAPPAPDEKH